MLNYEMLEKNVEKWNKAYASAPFTPHIYIDNFLLPEIAEQGFAKFPSLATMDQLRDMRQIKAQDPAIDKFDPLFHTIIAEHLHSPRFIAFMSQLTGIKNLKADPQLYAAGLAQGGNGSYLNVHIDNSSHPEKPWYRRTNILIYLNKHWSERKGGHVEFWDNDVKHCDAILPAFNRAVIFTVSPTSWHGYRRVVTPDGDSRKSINLYYFTEESPTGKDYYHVTSFKARPNEWLNKVRYPLDNLARTLYRKLRPQKDGHAVLFSGTPAEQKTKA